MKKIIAILLLSICIVYANSTTQSSHTIQAIGYGNSEDEALKNAFQSAVGEYVGVLVDSKTISQKGKLLEDKILTFSSGYIDSYKRLSSKEQMGLWEVKIIAVIQEQNILKQLKTLSIETKDIKDSDQIYAKLISQVKTKFDAEDMFANSVKEYGEPNLYKFLDMRIDDVHIFEDEATREYVPIEIKYSIYFNWERYEPIVKRFQKLFKDLGGNVIQQVKFVSTGTNRNIGIGSASNLPSTSLILITRNQNNELISEVWEFPKHYNVIYPFQKNATCSEYNQDDKKVQIFETKQVLDDVLKPKLLFKDENKKNLLPPQKLEFYLNSEEFSIFQELQWSELGHRCYGWGDGYRKVIAPPSVFENFQFGGRLIPNSTRPLFTKIYALKLKVKDIQHLKQITLEWNNK